MPWQYSLKMTGVIFIHIIYIIRIIRDLPKMESDSHAFVCGIVKGPVIQVTLVGEVSRI